MGETNWTHIGRDYTYALVVNGRIVGITYWLDSVALDGNAEGEVAVGDPGWLWVSVERPDQRHRVAQGLELRREMTDEELAETVEDALHAVGREVLAEGGED